MLNVAKKLANKNVPRWVVLSVDLSMSILTFIFAFAIINQFNIQEFTVKEFVFPLAVVSIFRLQSYLLTGSYTGIIKYTSSQDALRIFLALLYSSAILYIISQVYLYYTGVSFIKFSILVLDFFMLLGTLSAFRLGVKMVYKELLKVRTRAKRNVVIFGAGQTGIVAKRAIEADPHIAVRVVAFLDENPRLIGKTAEGVPIMDLTTRFEDVIQKFKPKEFVIAVTNLPAYKKKRIIELGLKYDLTIKNVPPIDNWINGEFSATQIKMVRIEDLLGREAIGLDQKSISQSVKDKIVLITGAAGSIGSEIARQCLRFKPKKVILLDQSETPLFEIEYELRSNPAIEVVMADVRDKGRLEKIFHAYNPEYVFHAAAYKHVPMMEDNPYEALSTNVFGTKMVADLAVQYGVQKFVFVSTDKAVNPTNIMGASKRMSEIYIQSLNMRLSINDDNHTKFITTRFGNVLGSNGSVIPRFKAQIEAGGPLTVTHPEITRFFMTIPEACQLVLEAGAMGRGGEIYIFDMGQSVKIVDMAKKMIKLSGFEVNKDIDIVFTGLRPGEKLKEELLTANENTIGTHHSKIMVAKVQSYKYEEVNDLINSLLDNQKSITNKLIVSSMKQLIPEYISNNSIYEELDERVKSKS
jgi:FlaA1/EpsC-like NDP-sugar epimerase